MKPLDANFNSDQPLCSIKASWLNAVANLWNSILWGGAFMAVKGSQNSIIEIDQPNEKGIGLKIRIPIAGLDSTLPSNAGKSKWMVVTMSDDNETEEDDPSKWSVDWTRAHG